MTIEIPEPKFKTDQVVWMLDYDNAFLKTKVKSVLIVYAKRQTAGAIDDISVRVEYFLPGRDGISRDHVSEGDLALTKEELINRVLEKLKTFDITTLGEQNGI